MYANPAAPAELRTVSALDIYGSDFGTGLPAVSLDGTPLSVGSNDGTRITANTTPARGFGTGSYRLMVSNGASTSQTGTFDLTVGSEGPQGPQGEVGPTPSTENLVDLTSVQTISGAKAFDKIITGSISGNAATADTAMALAPTATVPGSQVAGAVGLADRAATVSIPLDLSNGGRVLSLTNTSPGNLAMSSEARGHNSYGIKSVAGGIALIGESASDNDGPVHSVGVLGITSGGGGTAVKGEGRAHNATGVSGVGGAFGVYGESVGDNDGPAQSTGVVGYANVFNGTGVRGTAADPNSGTGVSGFGTIGLYGASVGSNPNGNNAGVWGVADAGAVGVRGTNTGGGLAGSFDGNVQVSGQVALGGIRFSDGSTQTTAAAGGVSRVILKSPGGACYKLTVSDEGALRTEAHPCP